MSHREPTHRVGVHLILIKGGKLLLIRRKNTSWHDGDYTFVTGHAEPNEQLLAAMAREAFEEAGIKISQRDMKIVHMMHLIDDYQAVLVMIKASRWKGVPFNKEPESSYDVGWFDLKKLPKNTAPYVRMVLGFIDKRVPFSEYRHRYL
jgi:8-oxo-dGTP diphosphatase